MPVLFSLVLLWFLANFGLYLNVEISRLLFLTWKRAAEKKMKS